MIGIKDQLELQKEKVMEEINKSEIEPTDKERKKQEETCLSRYE